MFDALQNGETLIDNDNNCEITIHNGKIIGLSSFFQISPECLTIKQKPKWYENLNGRKVWCKVWDKQCGNVLIRAICKYSVNRVIKFEDTDGIKWMNAEPLSSKEIQVYLDNALDIERDVF